MSEAASFEHDPDEPVTVSGIGTMPLRTAVEEFTKLSLHDQVATLILRDMSATPLVLLKAHLDWLRTLPAFQGSLSQDVEPVDVGPSVRASQHSERMRR